MIPSVETPQSEELHPCRQIETIEGLSKCMGSQEQKIEDLSTSVDGLSDNVNTLADSLGVFKEEIIEELKKGRKNFKELFEFKQKKEWQNGHIKEEVDEVKGDVKAKADATTLADLKEEVKELRKTFIYGVAVAILVIVLTNFYKTGGG